MKGNKVTTDLGQRGCPRDVLFPLCIPSKTRANNDTVPVLDHFSCSLHVHLCPYPIILLHQALDRGFLTGALWLHWGYPWTYRHTHFIYTQLYGGGVLGLGIRVLVSAFPMICCVLLDLSTCL